MQDIKIQEIKEVKKKIGFAAMTPERLKEIASLGGVACHVSGTGYQFNSETARKASQISNANRARRIREKANAL